MVDKLVNKAVICDKSGCKTLYLIYTYMISSLLLITKYYYLCIERHIIKKVTYIDVFDYLFAM